MSDEIPVEPLSEQDKEAAREYVEQTTGIQYVGEDGEPEERPEPPARQGPKQRPGPNDAPSLPHEPPDEETPPDDTVPAFLVHRNKFGPQAHGVYLADGTPVGIFLHESHPDLTGPQVYDLLGGMGLEEDLAAWFAAQRDGAIAARAQLMEMPEVRSFAESEALHEAQTAPIRKAFVEAQRKKR